MLETLISSKTRIKLLMKFFLNSNTTSYLRGLETELGDSSNAIRLELNRFEKAGMISSYAEGNRKYFKANTLHPLYQDMHSMIMKYVGFDKIIDNVIENLGHVQRVYVTGSFAHGLDDQIIDLVFVGTINKKYLVELLEKVEKHIHRKVRFIVYSEEEAKMPNHEDSLSQALLLWQNEV